MMKTCYTIYSAVCNALFHSLLIHFLLPLTRLWIYTRRSSPFSSPFSSLQLSNFRTQHMRDLAYRYLGLPGSFYLVFSGLEQIHFIPSSRSLYGILALVILFSWLTLDGVCILCIVITLYCYVKLEAYMPWPWDWLGCNQLNCSIILFLISKYDKYNPTFKLLEPDMV